MARADDEDWIDAVAGRDDAPLSEAQRRVAREIRALTRAQQEQALGRTTLSEGSLQRLLEHARRTDPARRRGAWARPVAWVAMLVLSVGIAWFYWLGPSGSDMRGSDALQIIQTRDAPQMTAQIVARLAKDGVVAKTYPLGNFQGLSARIPQDKRALVAADLAKWGVRVPPSGVLELEIRGE